MLNQKKYRETYDSLKEISEYGTDIIAGQGYGDLVEAETGKSRAEYLADGVEMQYAAECICDNANRVLDSCSELPLQGKVMEFSRNMLREKLVFYSDAEKKTIMISMLKKASEMFRQPMDEQEMILLTVSSLETIEKRLLEMVQILTHAVCENINLNVSADTDGELFWEHNTFSDGAASAAAYISDENMRKHPEFIGAVTGVIKTANKQWGEDNGIEILEWISFALTMVSVVVIMDFLLYAATGTVLTAVTDLIVWEPTIIFSDMCLYIKDSVLLLASHLKIAFGTAITSLVVKVLPSLFSDDAVTEEDILIEDRSNVVDNVLGKYLEDGESDDDEEEVSDNDIV